jgi:hypothetical protein
MTEVLVGRAYGLMELRYQQFTQGVSAVEQQINRLRQLTARPIVAQIGASGASGVGGASAAPAQLDAAQSRAALSAQRLATEQQRTALAAQRLSTEERRTATATAQADAAQSRASASALRLEQAQTRASRGGSTLGGVLRAIPTAVGALGISLGVQQLVSFGVESGKSAIALRETQNSLRAIAPSAHAYAEAIATAKRQQLLFGGSLRENIEGLSGLTITARQSGASLQTLVDLSQRLNVLSPEQGVGGARIALSEALSGNISSLSKRFEIPRSALKGLSDESKSVEERLAILDGFLNKVGVTSAAIAGKVDQDALAFRRLNAELETTQLRAGDQLATAFSRSATGLARLLGVINQNPQAIAELKALLSGRGVVTQADLDAATRGVAAQQSRDLLGGSRGAPEVSRRLGGGEQYAAVVKQLTDLKLAGGDAADSAERLTRQFLDGQIPADQYHTLLRAINERAREGDGIEAQRAQSLARSSDATRESANALSEETREKLADQVATAKLNEEQRQLAADSALAAQGLLGAGDQALILAEKYGIAASQAQFLINQQQQLTNAEGLADQRAGERTGGRVKSAKELQTQSDLARQKAQRDREEAARVAQAQTALDLSRARTASERIAILRREQAATTDQAEKLRIQAQIEAERNSGARSHTKELNTQLSLNERIRDSVEAQYKARLDAQELAIRDRMERRKEDQEIRQAQRILASGRASQAFKDAAADRLALIAVEREQRAQAIREKQATASGSLIGGRIFQSQPGISGGGVGAGTPPTAPGAPGAPLAPGGGLTIQFLVDGKLIANAIIPDIMNAQRASLARVDAAGGGQQA